MLSVETTLLNDSDTDNEGSQTRQSERAQLLIVRAPQGLAPGGRDQQPDPSTSRTVNGNTKSDNKLNCNNPKLAPI